MDRIAQAKSVFGNGAAGVSHQDSLAVASCPLRYVIDRHASAQCGDLIRSSPDLLARTDDLLRLPARLFWMEWFAEQDETGLAPSQKLGALVQADERARSGLIVPYAADVNGPVERLPGAIRFDLDQPFGAPFPPNGYRLAHGELRHLSPILSHALLHLDDRWATETRRRGAALYDTLVRHHAHGSWFILPFVLAFSALLNSDAVVDQQPSRLGELNASRGRRDRRPLLEHIEVTLRLGERRGLEAAQGTAASDASRTPPRLHFVRGHVVSRGGKTFWRTSHLRGEADSPISSKTVRVRAGGRHRALTATG